MDARWRDYLFQDHAEDTLRAWARRLRLFRFVRAAGGHANDGDSLLVVYGYRSEAELRGFFDGFGMRLVHHATRPPQPTPGVPYTWEQTRAFPSLIAGTEWIEQPGHCQLAGQAAFVWCSDRQIQLSLQQGFDVTEADISRAEIVERALQEVQLERVDPPVARKHCVCPAYYPAFFE
jgi:hypothetical protein